MIFPPVPLIWALSTGFCAVVAFAVIVAVEVAVTLEPPVMVMVPPELLGAAVAAAAWAAT